MEEININAIVAIATQELDDYGPELASLIILQSLNNEPITKEQLVTTRNRLERLLEAIDRQID